MSWKPPLDGTFKINIDRSYYSSSNQDASGGLICDSLGNPRATFHLNLSLCYRLKMRIHVSWELNLHHVIFEMDSLAVVHIVPRGSFISALLKPLFKGILNQLLMRVWQPFISHIYREPIKVLIFWQTLATKVVLLWLDSFSSPMLRMILSEEARGPMSCSAIVSFLVSPIIKKKS